MRKTYAALAPLLFMLTAAASPTEMARWRAEAGGEVLITRDDWGIATSTARPTPTPCSA